MKKKICVLLLFGTCLFSISACGNKVPSNNTNNVQDSFQTEETLESKDTEENIRSDVNTSSEENSNTAILKEAKNNDASADNDAVTDNDTSTDNELVDGMRPEFKEAMDSYESFYDEYCEILKKYTENPSDMEIITDYMNMLSKAAEMTEKFEAWENNDMNSAELKYYLDVNNRVTQKLLDASQ